MPIEFKCNQCGRLLRTPDETAGRQAKCPSCGSVQPIPASGETAEPSAPGDIPPSPPRPPGEDVHSPFGETLPYRGEGEPADQPTSSPFASAPPPSRSGAADSENPYQAPAEVSADIRYAYVPGAAGIQPTRIDIGDVLSRAWTIYKVHWGMCALVLFIVYAITFLISLFVNGVSSAVIQFAPGPAGVIMGQIVMQVINQLVGLWINLGMTLFMLNVARGKPPSIGDLFMGGRYLLTAVGSSLIMFVIFGSVAMVLVGPGLAALMAIGPEPLPVILLVAGGTVALIVFFVIFLMISQYMFLIIDRNAGPLESLMLSRELTAGNRLMIFLLFLVSIPLSMIGMLACCVGMLFTMSFFMLALSVQYLLMTGQPTGDQLWQLSANV